MKYYIKALIKSQGEDAAWRLAKDMHEFIEYLFFIDIFSQYQKWGPKETNLYWEKFQDMRTKDE